MGKHLQVSRLLTRRQIIEEWSRQDDTLLDMYCCPECRDILISIGEQGKYKCVNQACSVGVVILNFRSS